MIGCMMTKWSRMFFYSSTLSVNYIYSCCYVITHLLLPMRSLIMRWPIYNADKHFFHRLYKPRAWIFDTIIIFVKYFNEYVK